MGQRFKLGDRVVFKSDIEMYGHIVKFYATSADVEVWNSDTGQNEVHHVMICRLSADD